MYRQASPMGRRTNPVLFSLLFGGIWFCVGTLLFVIFGLVGGFPWTDRQLESAGVRAEAAVIRVERDMNTKINSRHPWRVYYRFSDRSGQAQESSSLILEGDDAQAMARAGHVSVLYLPDQPAVAKLVGTRYNLFPVWVFFFVGCFSTVGAAFLLWGVSRVVVRGTMY